MARDPIPRTRAALRQLVAEVGGPSYDELEAYGGPARSTTGDLLTKLAVPRWSTVAKLVGACREYHHLHHSRGLHDALVEAGRFDLQTVFDEETGAPAAGHGPEFLSVRARYLQRVRARYQRVDLEILTPLSDQGKHPPMRLDEVFMPQTVRANPPPVELPREVWRRLAEAGPGGEPDLPEHLDKQVLEAARRAYQERPVRPVLQVLTESAGHKAVVLGDPGAGKSSLARYLMLTHSAALLGLDAHTAEAEPGSSGVGEPSAAGRLPLLVELRTYADPTWADRTFLDLLEHLHASEGLGLPRVMLEEFLAHGGRAAVIFDGLDEVFDPRRREQITRQIEGFSAAHPRAQVIVTSRVLGYRRALLDSAGFSHWMLQDFDITQIQDFITTWYTRSCPSDSAEAGRLRERLLTAISSSAAVAELAGNPMLLTILAIVGRRRELPRDRRSVYEHAVTVLGADVSKASSAVRRACRPSIQRRSHHRRSSSAPQTMGGNVASSARSARPRGRVPKTACSGGQ